MVEYVKFDGDIRKALAYFRKVLSERTGVPESELENMSLEEFDRRFVSKGKPIQVVDTIGKPLKNQAKYPNYYDINLEELFAGIEDNPEE